MATQAEAEAELSPGLASRIAIGIPVNAQAVDWAKPVVALHAQAVAIRNFDSNRHDSLVDMAWALRRADSRKAGASADIR